MFIHMGRKEIMADNLKVTGHAVLRKRFWTEKMAGCKLLTNKESALDKQPFDCWTCLMKYYTLTFLI